MDQSLYNQLKCEKHNRDISYIHINKFCGFCQICLESFQNDIEALIPLDIFQQQFQSEISNFDECIQIQERIHNEFNNYNTILQNSIQKLPSYTGQVQQTQNILKNELNLVKQGLKGEINQNSLKVCCQYLSEGQQHRVQITHNIYLNNLIEIQNTLQNLSKETQRIINLIENSKYEQQKLYRDETPTDIGLEEKNFQQEKQNVLQPKLNRIKFKGRYVPSKDQLVVKCFSIDQGERLIVRLRNSFKDSDGSISIFDCKKNKLVQSIKGDFQYPIQIDDRNIIAYQDQWRSIIKLSENDNLNWDITEQEKISDDPFHLSQPNYNQTKKAALFLGEFDKQQNSSIIQYQNKKICFRYDLQFKASAIESDNDFIYVGDHYGFITKFVWNQNGPPISRVKISQSIIKKILKIGQNSLIGDFTGNLRLLDQNLKQIHFIQLNKTQIMEMVLFQKEFVFCGFFSGNIAIVSFSDNQLKLVSSFQSFNVSTLQILPIVEQGSQLFYVLGQSEEIRIYRA